MPGHRLLLRVSALCFSASAILGGCLLVTPLEDHPTTASAGQGGTGGGAGSQSAGEDAGGDTSKAGTGNGGSSGNANGSCQTNADCKRAGAGDPYLCRQSDHTCTRMRTELCPVVKGDSSDPNALVFGSFASLSDTAPEENAIIYAEELALNELGGDNVGGLPDGPGGARRPLVTVFCSNHDDDLDGALAHLIETLEVPAIVATLKPGDLRRAYEKYAEREVFYLSPVAATETVVELEDEGLVWNLLGQPGDLAPTYAATLEKTEAYLRKVLTIPSGEPTRVALVTTTDAFDSELANRVVPLLSFNGVSLEANQTNGDYEQYTLDASKSNDLVAKVNDLAEFAPHIVLSAASEVVTMENGLIDQIEAVWETYSLEQPEPTYVLSPYNAGDLDLLTKRIPTLRSPTGDPAPQRRFIGISIAGPEDTSLQFEYQTRLGASFGPVFNDTANYYDAVYLLAYAMYAAGTEQPLTGSRIARGMQRLLNGEPFPIGPNSIVSTFDALGVPQSSIDVQSTLGPPSFDGTTGVRQVDGSVFCFTLDGDKATRRFDTLRYDRKLKALRETDDFCFEDFMP